MMLIRSVASLLGLALLTSAQKCSVTQERDPGQVETVPCVFPFTYKGETFMTCTARDQPGGQEWCSTKVRLPCVYLLPSLADLTFWPGKHSLRRKSSNGMNTGNLGMENREGKRPSHLLYQRKKHF